MLGGSKPSLRILKAEGPSDLFAWSLLKFGLVDALDFGNWVTVPNDSEVIAILRKKGVRYANGVGSPVGILAQVEDRDALARHFEVTEYNIAEITSQVQTWQSEVDAIESRM